MPCFLINSRIFISGSNFCAAPDSNNAIAEFRQNFEPDFCNQSGYVEHTAFLPVRGKIVCTAWLPHETGARGLNVFFKFKATFKGTLRKRFSDIVGRRVRARAGLFSFHANGPILTPRQGVGRAKEVLSEVLPEPHLRERAVPPQDQPGHEGLLGLLHHVPVYGVERRRQQGSLFEPGWGHQILEGPFSAVSKPIFISEH